MEMKLEMVSVNKIVDAYSGVSMLDSAQTIMDGLTQAELERYGKAMTKIGRKQTLNIKDLKVFEKIDALTFEKHGMCLKDSHVTKERIRASKKYGIKFIDRDGLVDHMNQMMGLLTEKNIEVSLNKNLNKNLSTFILDRLGEERFEEFGYALMQILNGSKLEVEDWRVLSEVEYLTCNEFGFSIFDKDIQNAIDEACVNYKFDFASASKKVVH